MDYFFLFSIFCNIIKLEGNDNDMNIIDAVIILIILSGAVFGFKRGFTKQVLSFLGVFLVVVLAFWLKNPVSIFLYEHLPFFKFGGVLKGVTILNIALYELFSLFILIAVFTFVLKILIFASSVFERILSFTIVLGIPSKILGAIVGVIESFVWIFIILYILSLPVLHIEVVENSKLRPGILKNTPILSGFANETLKVVEEFTSLKEKYEQTPNANDFNRDTLDLFLGYNIITVDSVDRLIEKDKLQIDGVEEVLECYRNHTARECRERKEEQK